MRVLFKSRKLTQSTPEPAVMPRICYVHIPKSAGTYLRQVLQTGYRPSEICNFLFEGDFRKASRSEYMDKRLFCAHVGFDLARTLDADLITVLRNPFDRILSLYYYWKQVEGAPEQVRSMDLNTFLMSKDPVIAENVHNVQAWQLAFGHMSSIRSRHNVSDDELLNRAIENLKHFSIVGIYEQLNSVTQQIEERYGIRALVGDRVNETVARPSIRQTPVAVLEKIYARNAVDVALYDHVTRAILSGDRPPAAVA